MPDKVAKVGDKVYVQSKGMRNHGQQPVGGIIETEPDASGNIKVNGRQFHKDDIREVHPKK